MDFGFGLLDFLGLDLDVWIWTFGFLRIWIRFDRDTKMFNLPASLVLIRRADLFLRRLVIFCRFLDPG